MPRNIDVGVPTIPHSWPLDGWDTNAPGVFPGSLPKARQLLRYHRQALVAAGALVRVGRKIVVLGAPYHNWLAGHADRVQGFHLAVNGTAHRDKTGVTA